MPDADTAVPGGVFTDFRSFISEYGRQILENINEISHNPRYAICVEAAAARFKLSLVNASLGIIWKISQNFFSSQITAKICKKPKKSLDDFLSRLSNLRLYLIQAKNRSTSHRLLSGRRSRPFYVFCFFLFYLCSETIFTHIPRKFLSKSSPSYALSPINTLGIASTIVKIKAQLDTLYFVMIRCMRTY